MAWDLTYGRRPGELVTAGSERTGWARSGSPGTRRTAPARTASWVTTSTPATNGCIERRRSAVLRDEPRGYAAQARDYHAHFGLPFMLSETNMDGAAAEAWLATIWNDALVLRDEGLPIRGVCWYGFIDHVDWDTALREVNDRPNAVRARGSRPPPASGGRALPRPRRCGAGRRAGAAPGRSRAPTRRIHELAGRRDDLTAAPARAEARRPAPSPRAGRPRTRARRSTCSVVPRASRRSARCPRRDRRSTGRRRRRR